MSIDKETLEYDNNRGAITVTVDITMNVNDVMFCLSATFNNNNKRNEIRIVEALRGSVDFVQAFGDADVWASDEAEIEEAIAELEEREEPYFVGYGYNGSDTK